MMYADYVKMMMSAPIEPVKTLTEKRKEERMIEKSKQREKERLMEKVKVTRNKIKLLQMSYKSI